MKKPTFRQGRSFYVEQFAKSKGISYEKASLVNKIACDPLQRYKAIMTSDPVSKYL